MSESTDSMAKVVFVDGNDVAVLFDERTPTVDRTVILNRLLERVYRTAVENTILAIPDAMAYLTGQAVQNKEVRDKFLKRWHGKLDDPKMVEKVVTTIEHDNPAWSYEQILDESTKVLERTIEAKQIGDSVADDETVSDILRGV